MSTKQSRAERLDEHITELRRRAKLDTWNDFIREMAVPSDLMPAMMTMRTQLMPQARSLTAEDCDVLYRIIGVLMETNAALREHTENTALLVDEWTDTFKGIHTLATRIGMFANFEEGNPENAV